MPAKMSPEVLEIAQRQYSLRKRIREEKRSLKDLCALKREDIRKLEMQLTEADEEWESPMVQQSLL
jgi:hypothetical protein